jgi:hypothetical protein
MAIVVTLDQRASRHRPDDVARMADELNSAAHDGLTLELVRTAGDEMQGLVATGDGLATIVSRCLEEGDWWIGIGLGQVDVPLGRTARESRGPGFWHARDALTLAHKQKGGPPGPVAVVGEPDDIAQDLEAALSALAFIVTRRTARQREAIAASRGAHGLLGIARRLGIGVSAVSQLLRTAGREEQRRLESLIARLAEQVL